MALMFDNLCFIANVNVVVKLFKYVFYICSKTSIVNVIVVVKLFNWPVPYSMTLILLCLDLRSSWGVSSQRVEIITID